MWIHLIEESQELLSFIFSEKQQKKNQNIDYCNCG